MRRLSMAMEADSSAPDKKIQKLLELFAAEKSDLGYSFGKLKEFLAKMKADQKLMDLRDSRELLRNIYSYASDVSDSAKAMMDMLTEAEKLYAQDGSVPELELPLADR